MTTDNQSRTPDAAPDDDRFSTGGLRAPAHYSTRQKIWWWFDFIVLVNLARLRFLVILALVGATILYWDTLMSYYERWTRPTGSEAAAATADTEYWCPMHPTIIRDKPDKCPICGMPLSKRKKGETTDAEEALPAGVVSRVQLTPYKVVNAGVQTVQVGYQPLAKEITTVGFVEYNERKLAHIAAPVKGRIEKLYADVTGAMVKKGDPLAMVNIRFDPEVAATVEELRNARRHNDAEQERMVRKKFRRWDLGDELVEQLLRTEKTDPTLTIPSPIDGYVIKKYQTQGKYVEEMTPLYDVADLSTVWIEAQVYEDQIAFLKEGLPVTATTKAFPNREFGGKVAFIFPYLDTSTRTVKVRFDMHNPNNELRRGLYATITLQVPAVQLNGPGKEPSEEQRQMYQQGLVLAVPETAVIDTGSRKIVYRESEQDTFEGVDVQLGPRCGAFYPVLGGLVAGDRVATAGAFLIDAETRLTAGASATYFGATGGPKGTDQRAASAARPSLTRDDEDKVQSVLAKLSSEDRQLAESQRYCPILTDNQLGVMGKPVKVMVNGQPVLLCCKGCVNKALADPTKTLAKVDEVKARAKSGSLVATRPSTAPESGGTKSAKIKAALARLSLKDRQLAEEQVYCPETEQPLGAMGVPVKVTVNGQTVFVCCPSCVDDAKSHADQLLQKIADLKAKAKATPERK